MGPKGCRGPLPSFLRRSKCRSAGGKVYMEHTPNVARRTAQSSEDPHTAVGFAETENEERGEGGSMGRSEENKKRERERECESEKEQGKASRALQNLQRCDLGGLQTLESPDGCMESCTLLVTTPSIIFRPYPSPQGYPEGSSDSQILSDAALLSPGRCRFRAVLEEQGDPAPKSKPDSR